MEVRDILKSDRHTLVSVQTEMGVTEAARIMANNGIGFTTVLDSDEKLVGVLSERDILASLSEGTEMADRTSVGSVMTQKLITCDVADSVLCAIELMGNNSIRHLVVMEEDEIAGVLSSRDLFDIMAKRIDERGLVSFNTDDDDEEETLREDEALSA
ncbi:MAG: CBS domain-containing protein [Rhodospirillaceae bacterium]|jgi:CBS domain-containing protein|nr:CBS domain-containing protein [Rhodospirillaceae bacterium]MBT5455052.1 CBS domain-containing protein [Rhodospirillaceae bacterium]